jgi:hypothetical protein
MEKRCSKCKQVLPLENFHKNKSIADGHASVCKQCFKLIGDVRRKDTKDEVAAYNKQYRQQNLVFLRKKQRDALVSNWQDPEQHPQMLLYQIKSRAKRDNIPFDLTVQDLVIPQCCPILGIPLSVGQSKMHEGSPTVDRIQPHLGYVSGNVRVISFKANRLKSNMDIATLQSIIRYIQENMSRIVDN